MRFPIAALLLLAALLLSPLAASAQKPAPLPARMAELPYRTIALHHARPADILSAMHWQDGRTAKEAGLPDGVVRIFALQSNNSLLLQATEAGYKQVQEIVKTFDIAPRQVELTVRFVAVSLDKKLTVDLSNSIQALSQLYTADVLFSQPILETVDDGKPADFSPPWSYLDPQTLGGSNLVYPLVRLTPRINKDNSVTLDLDAEEQKTQVLDAIHTVPDGGTTVYEMTSWVDAIKRRVFLFVTPTIVGTAPTPAPEKTVALNIINGDLQSALKQMGQQYGIKYVIQDGIGTQRVINVNMSDIPLSEAVRFIASAANAQVTQNSDGVYVFSSLPQATGPQEQARPAPEAQFSGNTNGYTQGFLGFRPFVPSDTLWPTAWLNSLGWQMRNQADGTTNRPKIGIDAPKLNSLQPSSVRRIFAL